MYPLGAITSLSGGNLIVNGTSTYYSVLQEGDEVTLNEQTVEVSSVTNDTKFTVKTAFASGSSGDILYAVSKCVWLRYQIWRLELAIANYDIEILGIEKTRNGNDEVQFNDKRTPLSELTKLKSDYERQLAVCEASDNDTSVWIVRRYETGTL